MDAHAFTQAFHSNFQNYWGAMIRKSSPCISWGPCMLLLKILQQFASEKLKLVTLLHFLALMLKSASFVTKMQLEQWCCISVPDISVHIEDTYHGQTNSSSPQSCFAGMRRSRHRLTLRHTQTPSPSVQAFSSFWRSNELQYWGLSRLNSAGNDVAKAIENSAVLFTEMFPHR